MDGRKVVTLVLTFAGGVGIFGGIIDALNLDLCFWIDSTGWNLSNVLSADGGRQDGAVSIDHLIVTGFRRIFTYVARLRSSTISLRSVPWHVEAAHWPFSLLSARSLFVVPCPVDLEKWEPVITICGS